MITCRHKFCNGLRFINQAAHRQHCHDEHKDDGVIGLAQIDRIRKLQVLCGIAMLPAGEEQLSRMSAYAAYKCIAELETTLIERDKANARL